MIAESPELAGAGTWGFRGIRATDSSAMARKEEDAALAAFFWDKLNPIKARLYNYIRKALNFSSDADDVYQETILHAYKYVRTYQDGRDFGAWLFGIAQNEIKKHYKKNPRITISLDAERLGLQDPCSERQIIEEIYRFAEQLKPRQREVFFLFYDQGFTIPEIAGITGLGKGNIKFVLNRARQALRGAIGEKHE
jgi:RNA polymerase sigma-70 factor (ECF subfamily)